MLQLYRTALSSLRSEVDELNSRLVAAARAKEASEETLLRAEAQAIRAEQKIEQQAVRHEERLTELHSVIAELGRQLERQRATVITEEDESGKLGNCHYDFWQKIKKQNFIVFMFTSFQFLSIECTFYFRVNIICNGVDSIGSQQ